MRIAAVFLCLGQDQDPTRLLPLSAGNQWTFDGGATLKVLRKVKPKDEELFVLEWKQEGVKETFHWQTAAGGIKEYWYRIEKARSATEIPPHEPIFILVFPPDPGRKWDLKLVDRKTGRRTAVSNEILRSEEVEVPAGKFTAIPVRRIVTEDSAPSEEITLWFAMDAGIVMRRAVDLEKKTEQTFKLLRSSIQRSKPAVSEPLAGLEGLVQRALSAGDYESALVLVEAHPDDRTRQAAAEARGKLSSSAPDSSLDAALESWGKGAGARCELMARSAKDAGERLDWEMRGMLTKYLPQHCKALRTLNAYRKSSGLVPVAWSGRLARGAMLHARYLALTNPDELKQAMDYHSEKVASPYFTAEGARVAASAVIGGVSLDRAVDEWIWSFYHRLGPLDPRLREVGTGMWEGISSVPRSVMDVTGGRSGGEAPDVVLFPAPGQSGVSPTFSQVEEVPSPVPGENTKLLGPPITAIFFRGSPAGVRAALFHNGQEVECRLHTPEKPSNPEVPVRNVICLFPRARLAKGAYVVRMSSTVGSAPWQSEWSFTTR